MGHRTRGGMWCVKPLGTFQAYPLRLRDQSRISAEADPGLHSAFQYLTESLRQT